MTTVRTARHHRGGAPLLPPTIAYAVLTILAVAVPPLLAGEFAYSSDSNLLDFYREHGAAAHASAFFSLGAAIPLAVVTAVATSRMRTLGLDVPGRIIAQVGGTIASALLAVAGLSTLALTQPHVADSPGAIRALNGFAFATGGAGFVVFAGLLVAGLSITALIGGVLPRWLSWAGVAIAGISELASLSVAFADLDLLLPIARFSGLVWLVAIGLALPARRQRSNPSSTS